MDAPKQGRLRFSLLTVIVWLLVAGGMIFLMWNVITGISGRNLPLSTSTPNRTEIYRTIAVMLTVQGTSPAPTLARTSTPSATPSPSQAASTRTPPTSTITPGGGTHTATPSVLCDRAAAGSPLDITIPDDSFLSSGQSFIKTWKLVNTGTCTWTTQYSASFFYGDRMDAPQAVPLQAAVQPAQSVEISIEMVAPESPGTFQGNWMLSNPTGALFGIGPNSDAPFWVRIIVVQDATPTATLGVTPTTAPTDAQTPTETPEGEFSGRLSPAPGDSIDLDTLALNVEEADLNYHTDPGNYHWLIPQDDAVIGVYGSHVPALADCQVANMSSTPLAVDSLPVGTYLCYTTGEGRVGRALLEAVDPVSFSLTLYLVTWLLP